MKILVISDTHSIALPFFQLISDYKDEVDYIVHCGDSELPYDDTIWSSIDAFVKGNMDFDYRFSNEQLLQTKQVNIFVTHGHLYGVNTSRQHLSKIASSYHCRLAFYGHTHILSVEKINDVICINPGSFNHSRGPVKERTYAIVTINEHDVEVVFYRYDKTVLPHLTQKITY